MVIPNVVKSLTTTVTAALNYYSCYIQCDDAVCHKCKLSISKDWNINPFYCVIKYSGSHVFVITLPL